MSVESVSLDTNNKIKKKNWTELERKIGVFEGKYFILFGKFKGAGEGRLTRCCMKGSCPGGERVSFSPSSIVVLF